MLVKQVKSRLEYNPIFSRETIDRTSEEILGFIPLMEREFDRVEKIVGAELKPEAAYYYYDFYDLAHVIKLKLRNFPKSERVGIEQGKAQLNFGVELFEELNWVELWKLLLLTVQIDQVDHGFLEKKIKDKTVLKLLIAIKNSFR
ncbi:hypothetical protein GCM10028791_32600 [Echinicola sediminis]